MRQFSFILFFLILLGCEPNSKSNEQLDNSSEINSVNNEAPSGWKDKYEFDSEKYEAVKKSIRDNNIDAKKFVNGVQEARKNVELAYPEIEITDENFMFYWEKLIKDKNTVSEDYDLYNYDVSGSGGPYGGYVYGNVDADDESGYGYLYDEEDNEIYVDVYWIGNGLLEGTDKNGWTYSLEVD